MNQFAAFGRDSRKGIQRLPDYLAGHLGANGGRSPAIGQIADASKTSLVHEHHQWRAPSPGALSGYFRGEVFLKAASAAGSFLG